jgi:carbamoyltransferase
MGDGGGAVGAAMEVCRRLDPGRCLDNSFEHLYLGPAFTRGQIEAELPRHAGLSWRPVDDPDVALARAVAQGKVVARFDGPMEYGPRALGNRSILCHATDASVNDWLNQRLRRTEYMPFAPTILERRAAECLEGWRPEHRAAWFMTTTYRGTPGFRGCAQGVVNVDHTTRPQVLRHSANPGYHRLIEEHERLTGLPYVLNTSFNMHEEPIVCTPRDALRAFRQARLDLMGLGPYLVEPREG